MLGLHFLSLAAARSLAGGWSEAPASAKITALAQYSLRSLAEEFCASSNAFGCSRLQGATFVSVTSAHTQVVAGTNYEIEMSTSAGPLTIRVYEQLWTGTLTVTSASVRNAGNRLGVYAVLQDGEEHAMDAADFEEFRQALAAPASGSPLLVGGVLAYTRDLSPTFPYFGVELLFAAQACLGVLSALALNLDAPTRRRLNAASPEKLPSATAPAAPPPLPTLAEPEGGSGRWSGTARPVPRVPDAPSEAPI